MKKTEKLGLNILEGSDPISVEGFNENAQLLDTLVSQKCTMTTGSWQGDGTANKVLTFARKPILVFIYGPFGVGMCFQGATYAFQHNFIYSQLMTLEIAWDTNANTLTLQNDGYFNKIGDTYHYIAFLEN